MITKRIIPCLDIKDGRTVKGTNFEHLRDMGDPVSLATYYAEQGADELLLLDISATDEKRKTLIALIKEIAAAINIPFTVGGGISSVADVYNLLNSGADKISVNTAAFKEPGLIRELANRFGSQCVVVAIDTKYELGNWYVYLHGGKLPTRKKTTEWVAEITDLGAGEILLTSIDNDGTKKGFAIELVKDISQRSTLPVIASGGAGTMSHFADVFINGNADAALAAGIFHSKELEIPILKNYLQAKGLNIRI